MVVRVGLVLSGGGARGAYEVGVLSWVLDELPQLLRRPVTFDVVTGTSVGAIHACYVAAAQGTVRAGAALVSIWQQLEVGGVYEIGLTDVMGLPFRLLGLAAGHAPGSSPGHIGGLLDTAPLERLVHDAIPWELLRRNVDGGSPTSLAITSTEVATGKSVVWVDGMLNRPWTHDPFVVARGARIGPEHALASAAIPFLFPALRIDGGFYCDGGLRMNTPLSPALRLGVDRLLIVGLRHRPTPHEDDAARAEQREQAFPSLAYLAGKVLNALLLDHVDYDVDRLSVLNTILEAGASTCGPEFLGRVRAAVKPFGDDPYKIVRYVYLQPSADLGGIAAECISHERTTNGLRGWLADAVVRRALRGIGREADLLSYLLFDKCYAAHLIELGRRDAAARAAEIVALFDGTTPVIPA